MQRRGQCWRRHGHVHCSAAGAPIPRVHCRRGGERRRSDIARLRQGMARRRLGEVSEGSMVGSGAESLLLLLRGLLRRCSTRSYKIGDGRDGRRWRYLQRAVLFLQGQGGLKALEQGHMFPLPNFFAESEGGVNHRADADLQVNNVLVCGGAGKAGDPCGGKYLLLHGKKMSKLPGDSVTQLLSLLDTGGEKIVSLDFVHLNDSLHKRSCHGLLRSVFFVSFFEIIIRFVLERLQSLMRLPFHHHGHTPAPFTHVKQHTSALPQRRPHDAQRQVRVHRYRRVPAASTQKVSAGRIL
mmetsp:Transcript_8299/g.18102  ORF Transcript_8299/g.18102 Transcript_8299/m.18102 type:complete len:296 (-) Transcript_8299:581-1468(-)